MQIYLYRTNEVYTSSVIETLAELGVIEAWGIDEEIPFDSPDTDLITQICNEHDIDGLIISKLLFIHMTYTAYGIPYAKNFDTEVEMKLFDKTGRLILSTIHSTLHGNSYFMPPAPEVTIYDGTNGALKRILKEMEIKKVG